MRTGHRHILPIFAAALVGLGCSLVLADCGAAAAGTGTGTGTAGSGGANPALKYAQCMRAHGVTNFPDPSPSGGGIDIGPGSGINPQSPVFGSAQQACAKIGGPGGPGHPVTASQHQRLLALSQCMRTHGVPGFPDPVFPATGGATIQLQRGSGVDPTSPAFQAASRTCGGPRPGPGFHRAVAVGGGANARVPSGG